MRNIIETNAANCQDCYRCVRVCTVGAIRVEGGQARVDGTLCIQCGTCVRECPQQAKTIYDSLGIVQAWIDAGERVVASVAPSFAGVYAGWRAMRVPAALRLLGFSTVSETAEGAKAVATASAQDGSGSITTCCPTVVSYIEKYRPNLLPMLMPLASPMVAHGRMLKARHGEDAKVVFIGPCPAKKGEAMDTDAVDAVLTFQELQAWMDANDIDLSRCPESDFDTYGDPGAARLFPLEGGLLKTAGVADEVGDTNVLRISGAHDVLQLLDTPISEWGYAIVEPMFCRGGCANGPCMPRDFDPFAAARAVAAYAGRARSMPGDSPQVPLDAQYGPKPIDAHLPPVSEARIRRILEDTGKASEADQLNCGACGYPTCRDNAIAVARGMAEPGMCMSYVRQKAERRAEHIIRNSPNGIVVVNADLNIVHMNMRFQQMFGCSGNLIGQTISRVVDPEGFERLISGAEGTQEAIRMREDMKYQELIFTLPGEQEICGIYVDVSHSTFDARQVDLIKDQSLRHASELLAHQIRFSQEMAHYLGKSTAQTEELVKRMMDMYGEDSEA